MSRSLGKSRGLWQALIFTMVAALGLGVLAVSIQAATYYDNVNVSAFVPPSLTLNSINPNSVTAGTAGFSMTLVGTGFTALSTARLDGADRVTTFVSSTQLLAAILTADIASAGSRSIAVYDSGLNATSNALALNVVTGGGGGGGTDSSAPIILNPQAINITQNSAFIIWDTDEPATSIVDYGLTSAYTGTVSNGSLVLSHGLQLNGLQPNTLYHFRVTSADQYNNTALSLDYTFTTLPASPLIISNVTSTNITDISAIITWNTNRSASTRVEYGLTTSLGGSVDLGGSVLNHAVSLVGLSPATLYYYQVISTDDNGITATSSQYTFTTLSDQTAPTNIQLDATAGDTVVLLEWTQPPEPDFAGVRLVRRADQYPTGPYDGDFVYSGLLVSTIDTGLTNGVTYYYGAYAFDTVGNFSSGALDFATPVGTIQIPPTPTSTTTTPPIPPATTTPPIPPATTTPPIPPATTTPPITPITPTSTATTTPSIPGVSIYAQYYTAGGSLQLQPDASGAYGVLGNAPVLVVVPTANLGVTVQNIILTVEGHTYSLALNAQGTSYEGTFQAPPDGTFSTYIQAAFDGGLSADIQNPFIVQNPGEVVEAILGSEPAVLPGATVTIYQNQNGTFVPFNASVYGQSNPTQSSNDGSFAFAVPNGQYYVEVAKQGYTTERSPVIDVNRNVFGDRVSLIRIPKPLEVTETFPYVENAPAQFVYTAQVIQSILREPEVVEATENIAAPAMIAVSILNSVSAVSIFNLLAYLQFLFTQPILLFGRLSKKRYGVIYNSLTKMPVEYAIVRLVNYETRMIVQSKVTDKNGRYFFSAQPGNYYLEIVKPNYDYPSEFLADRKSDEAYPDLYHGEMIALAKQGIVASNVPLDPVHPIETPKRIIYRKVMHELQHGVALLGVALAFVALVISPTWFVGGVLVLQLAFYFLFRRLAIPARSKPWGRVLDAQTGKPVSFAVVRIFDKKFNKLLEVQVTDRSGRYGFFVNKNLYYITVEKPGFQKYKSADIDLISKTETVVDMDIVLKLE